MSDFLNFFKQFKVFSFLMKKLLNFIPAIVIFCLIFYFSSQTGEESNKLSDPIANNFYLFFGTNTLHFFVLLIRKSAHIIEFIALYCFILYGFVKSFRIKLIYSYLYSYVLTYFSAVFDEVHQAFVPNRTGAFVDTLIDISGVTVILILTLIIRELKKSPS